MRFSLRSLALYGAALLGFAGLASAEDWPQYRRDAQHSGVSKDRLHLPLTELWSWKHGSKEEFRPLYHAVTWHGSVFFTACEKGKRSLICADERTGSETWRQKLEATHLGFPISDVAGPAVTQGGQVFVYDNTMLSAQMVKQILGPDGPKNPGPRSSFTVRAFRAKDGAPGGYMPLAAMAANGVIPRLSLLDGPLGRQGELVAPVPPKLMGCPP